MKVIRSISIISLTILLIGIGCKSNKKEIVEKAQSTTSTNLNFLNAKEASEKIVVDNSDGFFDNLSIADMSIQMKKVKMPTSGGEAKVMYQDMLVSEMSDFTPEEEEFMERVFASARKAINNLNPKLYPTNIDLIKTKINHYGPDVYYTRDEAIVLPENIFESPSVKVQMPVMLHEIFHILSRYHPEFRDKMYALIHFEQYHEDLILPKYIEDRILTNPDGVRRDYAINLVDESGEKQKAVPLIMTKRERYSEDVPSFFSYLNFDLFPLISIEKNQVTLGINQKGESSLSIEHNADFFKKIKDNTAYIIHPDEIMADNFMMAVIAYRDDNYEGFSEEGKKLLLEVIEILKSFDQ